MILHETRGGWEPDLGGIGGIALYRDSLYVFDPSEPAVVAYDSTLRRVRQFGRRGRGPGELVVDAITGGIPDDHLAVDERGIAVADEGGQLVQWYRHDGRYSRQARIPAMPSSRLRFNGDTAYMALSGFGRGVPRDTFSVAYSFDGVVESFFSMPKHEYPTTPSGAMMIGANEARPLWDLQGDCLIVNDGHDPTVTYYDRRTGTSRSVSFELPDYDFPSAEAKTVVGMRFPKYALLRRFRQLILDPSGAVWLDINATSASRTSRYVARVLPDGAVAFDTLPFFPRAFADDGRVYGTVVTHMQGEVQVKVMK